MATTVIPEISKRSPYYISKHRYYELKHFCLQYPEWKKRIKELNSMYSTSIIFSKKESNIVDTTSQNAIEIFSLERKCQKVDQTIKQLEPWIQRYIFLAVTEGRSFTYLKTMLDLPCERDAYYERYRRFWYSLNLQLV